MNMLELNSKAHLADALYDTLKKLWIAGLSEDQLNSWRQQLLVQNLSEMQINAWHVLNVYESHLGFDELKKGGVPRNLREND